MRQTEEAYAAQVRERLEKQFHRRARELGDTLTNVETAAPPAAEERCAAAPVTTYPNGGRRQQAT